MRDNILLTYVLTDILFVVCGGLLIIFALTTQAEIGEMPTLSNVARDLLLNTCPLKGRYPHLLTVKTTADRYVAAIGNAALVFFTFLISVPAMVMPMTRGWLKFHGYMTVVCALFTMVIGLTIWFETLKTRKNLSVIYAAQPLTTQSLIQQRVRLPLPLSTQNMLTRIVQLLRLCK
jgi:hypothetical protein